MKRSKEVLSRVFNLLKDEEVLAKLSKETNIENSYEVLKEELENITENEYREAIKTIRENDGQVVIASGDGAELTDEELEQVAGGGVSLKEIDVSVIR